MLPESYQEAAYYKEVFTICQFYSKNMYHSNIDQIPRIAPYLQFLRDNPEIKVHIGMDNVISNSNTLGMLGINSNRIVNGTVRAGIVYFPEGSMSNFPRVQNVQILSKEYRTIIRKLILIQEHKSVIMMTICKTQGVTSHVLGQRHYASHTPFIIMLKKSLYLARTSEISQ